MVGGSSPAGAGATFLGMLTDPRRGPSLPPSLTPSRVTATAAPAPRTPTVPPLTSGVETRLAFGPSTDRATPGIQKAKSSAADCCSGVAPSFLAPYPTPFEATVPSASPLAI